MNSDLKLKRKATAGHNGSSRGSSKRKRKGKPVTQSALKQESEESKRRRLKEGKAQQKARVLADPKAYEHGRRRQAQAESTRARKAPRRRPRVHKDPGAAPPRPTGRTTGLEGSQGLKGRLAAADPSDRRKHDQRMADLHARYRSTPAKVDLGTSSWGAIGSAFGAPTPVRKKDTLYDYRTKFTSEEDARYAALKAEYSLDKFAKAKPIDFERWEKETTEHKTLKDKLQKEIRDTEAEQLRYEHAGRRTLDPLQSMGGKRISDQPRRRPVKEADLPKPIYPRSARDRGRSLGLGRPHDRTAALSAPTKAQMAEYGMVPKKLMRDSPIPQKSKRSRRKVQGSTTPHGGRPRATPPEKSAN